MPVGSKYQVVIPAALAYGQRGPSADIGPNATLIFEIELLSIKEKPASSAAPAPRSQAGNRHRHGIQSSRRKKVASAQQESPPCWRALFFVFLACAYLAGVSSTNSKRSSCFSKGIENSFSIFSR